MGRSTPIPLKPHLPALGAVVHAPCLKEDSFRVHVIERVCVGVCERRYVGACVRRCVSVCRCVCVCR